MSLQTIKYVTQFPGSPEGLVAAPVGEPLIDRNTGDLYIKKTAASLSTGWERVDQVSSVRATGTLVNRSISDRFSDSYSVKDFSENAGEGVTSDHEAIGLADTAAGSSRSLFFPPGTYKISQNTTINAGALIFSKGAMLSIDSGVTVTINGTIQAPLAQIFSGLGTVSLGGNLLEVYPQWWGATGNGTTDDTTAIQSAATSAYAAAVAGVNGKRTILRFPVATSYKTTNTVTVKVGVSVQMDSPLVYSGSDEEAALVIGETGPGKDNWQLKHRLQVRRSTQSTWASESNIGIKLFNPIESNIEIVRTEGFTIGLQVMGSGSDGAVYNHFTLGRIVDNKIGIDLASETAGWVNENNFYGGRFTCSGGVGSGLERTGIRFSGGTDYHTGNNKFWGPSFELHSTEASPNAALPVDFVKGIDNIILYPRAELIGPYFARASSTSIRNQIIAGYNVDVFGYPVQNNGDFVGVTVTGGGVNHADKLGARPVFNSGPLHKLACYYDGATALHIPRIHWATSASTPTANNNSTSGVTIGADYLSVTTGQALGVFMDTRSVKRFVVRRDVSGSANSGRIGIRCYDSSGNVLTSAGASHPYVRGSISFTFNTAYGGQYQTSSTVDYPVIVEVGADVAYVAVLFIKGVVDMQIRSFSIESLDSKATSVWAGYEEVVPGTNIGTTFPTAGTWGRGRRIYNAVPSASGVEGWICTTAPNTWKAFGTIAA